MHTLVMDAYCLNRDVKGQLHCAKKVDKVYMINNDQAYNFKGTDNFFILVNTFTQNIFLVYV